MLNSRPSAYTVGYCRNMLQHTDLMNVSLTTNLVQLTQFIVYMVHKHQHAQTFISRLIQISSDQNMVLHNNNY